MQTSMKIDDLSYSFQCKPEIIFFKSDFLNQNDVLRGTLCTRTNMSTKKAVLLANEHHSDQVKCYKQF